MVTVILFLINVSLKLFVMIVNSFYNGISEFIPILQNKYSHFLMESCSEDIKRY